MKRDVCEYLFKNELEIRVYLDKIDIINYDKLGHIDSSRIVIYSKDRNIVITGCNLTLSKLLNNELLVIGRINNIELG